MIVRHVDDRLQLITQPDHAQLRDESWSTASRWRRAHEETRFSTPLPSTITAGPKRTPRLASIPPPARYSISSVRPPAYVRPCGRGIARLADDPWAAALVAQHAITIYDRFRPESAWRPFFAEMEARDRMLRADGGPRR